MYDKRAIRSMKARLISREVLPFYPSLLALVAATLLYDAVLHLLNAVWIGRWLGILGTLMILGSLAYSTRKRKVIRSGQTVKLLRSMKPWPGQVLCLCWCTWRSISIRSSRG